jgi:deoxyribonuclease-1-like protein
VRKSGSLLLLVVLGVAAWFFFQNFRIEGLRALKVVPREGLPAEGNPTSADQPLPIRTGETIRIATFNIQVLGTTKMNKPHVVAALAKICREFDVVAIQEVRSRDQDIIPRLVDAINEPGRKYDFVIGPRLPLEDDQSNYREQYAFIFDRETLETDRYQLYTVHDPHDLLAREPLVGWFRVRGPPTSDAFTFMLVNVHTDPDKAEYECEQLAQVYYAVLDAGTDEDDVILLGDFNVDDQRLGSIMHISGMEAAVRGVTTNTRGTAMYDNLIFHRPSTAEFTGRSGVLDFAREYSLNLEEALEISDHLPVWAEFTVMEGGRRATVAGREPNPVR